MLFLEEVGGGWWERVKEANGGWWWVLIFVICWADKGVGRLKKIQAKSRPGCTRRGL